MTDYKKLLEERHDLIKNKHADILLDFQQQGEIIEKQAQSIREKEARIAELEARVEFLEAENKIHINHKTTFFVEASNFRSLLKRFFDGINDETCPMFIGYGPLSTEERKLLEEIERALKGAE